MEIKLEFDSKNVKDVKLVGVIGLALSVVAGMENASGAEHTTESTSDEKGDSEQEAVKDEDLPSEPRADIVPEEKPKRTRRSKKTEDVPAPQENSASEELPFDAELKEEPMPVEPTPAESVSVEPETDTKEAPKFPTMTKDEFTSVNKAKRAELGLTVDGKHSDLISAFNGYCQRMSQMFYGNPKPSTLPPEELWQYADWFKTIQLNPDYIPGAADEEHGNPFVSTVPSNNEPPY